MSKNFEVREYRKAGDEWLHVETYTVQATTKEQAREKAEAAFRQAGWAHEPLFEVEPLKSEEPRFSQWKADAHGWRT